MVEFLIFMACLYGVYKIFRWLQRDRLSQMVVSQELERQFRGRYFPYDTYEAWYQDFCRAAAEENDALAPLDDAQTVSLIDMMDDEPCKRAYKDRVDPISLGRQFGQSFDPLKMGFK